MGLNPKFIKIVKRLRDELLTIKDECRKVEDSVSQAQQYSFLDKNKKEFFNSFDYCFSEIWKCLENLGESEYLEYQDQLIRILDPYLCENLEIVSYIRSRPLGYAGDYVTMNYIYDFNCSTGYLGKSLYEKLLNLYTCSIQVSCSNIARKNYLKGRILKKINNQTFTKILSIGSGPARELIELLRENKIKKSIQFNCLDFETKAIAFVKEEVKKISFDQSVEINFFSKDLLNLVKNKGLFESFKNMDLLYISGVFDYFTDRLCKRTIENLCPLLAPSGEFIIFNMSLENASHRAYYEAFAKWKMKHRTRDDMLLWIKGNTESFKYSINDVDDCPSYHILNITRE